MLAGSSKRARSSYLRALASFFLREQCTSGSVSRRVRVLRRRLLVDLGAGHVGQVTAPARWITSPAKVDLCFTGGSSSDRKTVPGPSRPKVECHTDVKPGRRWTHFSFRSTKMAETMFIVTTTKRGPRSRSGGREATASTP